MGITAFQGPNIVFGVTGTSTNGSNVNVADYNDQRAPSLFDLGQGLMDPRGAYNYDPGSAVTAQTMGLYGGRGFVDYVPTTLSASAFVSASVVSSGVTTFTLNAASSALGTYATTIIAPENGTTTGTLLAIDSTAAVLAFAQSGTVAIWNPGAGTGRCISITTSSSGDAGTFSIAGRDMYGFKMTETIAITEGTTNSSGYSLTSKKAFKYISSITNASTPTSTSVSIGIADKYGYPLKVPYFGHDTVTRILAGPYSSAATVAISSANALIASSVTATSTTADVRGTYTSTTASNGTVRLQLSVTPSASAVFAVSASDVSPLFGALQYSSI